jgi:hypothetical protein
MAAAGRKPSPGLVRRAQTRTGPEVAALHDRLRQLSRCAFAHQRRMGDHAQSARRRLGGKMLLAAKRACGGRACAIRCDCVALRRQPRVGSRRAGCSSPPVNQTQGGLRDATQGLIPVERISPCTPKPPSVFYRLHFKRSRSRCDLGPGIKYTRGDPPGPGLFRTLTVSRVPPSWRRLASRRVRYVQQAGPRRAPPGPAGRPLRLALRPRIGTERPGATGTIARCASSSRTVQGADTPVAVPVPVPDSADFPGDAGGERPRRPRFAPAGTGERPRRPRPRFAGDGDACTEASPICPGGDGPWEASPGVPRRPSPICPPGDGGASPSPSPICKLKSGDHRLQCHDSEYPQRTRLGHSVWSKL